MSGVFNFEVRNLDVSIRFSCPNYKRRLSQIVDNLGLDFSDPTSTAKMKCCFTALTDNTTFLFDNHPEPGKDIRHNSVFFENTEYPLIVRSIGKKLSDVSIFINGHSPMSHGEDKQTIISNDGELYGSLNFHNQVGMTDFTIEYRYAEDYLPRRLSFKTEVLSYKLDYRSDLRTIISDIEHEYALLSTSFLKYTYLTIRTGNGKSSPLIWWQIFKSCYNDIIDAALKIIDKPKRRLHPVPKYERVEKMAYIPRELENEYQSHKGNPEYLYRTEDMVLSHDTIENQFLKYVLKELLRKFIEVKEHILTAMYLDNPMRIDNKINDMEDKLLKLNNHSFFRGIGQFRGFTQDNLVMKQAYGYKTILEKWIELQQGYELEEGLRKLEVKEISDLYEIWCFIKVKNIVQEILVEQDKDTTAEVNGSMVTKDFIPKLIYGGSVNFMNHDKVELASVCYNAEVRKSDSHNKSVIDGTDTFTTVQRPDIVLQLSKTSDAGMKYTYLFDAKYRVDDQKEGNGYDVPPEDAIDQMHRYRDAIYYTEGNSQHEHLKKEIIAGYVLFPGSVPLTALNDGSYYYGKSGRMIGIGAFPLRPNQEQHDNKGTIIIDPNSSEQALRTQIKEWLTEENSREKLLEDSIPQKGLEYTITDFDKGGIYYLSNIDPHVNIKAEFFIKGEAKVFYSGYGALLSGVDFQKLKYLAPVIDHKVYGYYRVVKSDIVDLGEVLTRELNKKAAMGVKPGTYNGYDKPYRVMLKLGNYVKLETPFIYGISRLSAIGTTLNSTDFKKYCKAL